MKCAFARTQFQNGVPVSAVTAEVYRQYKGLADATPNVHFVGRLATYKYYNMDQVVAQSLAEFERIMGRKSPNGHVNGRVLVAAHS